MIFSLQDQCKILWVNGCSPGTFYVLKVLMQSWGCFSWLGWCLSVDKIWGLNGLRTLALFGLCEVTNETHSRVFSVVGSVVCWTFALIKQLRAAYMAELLNSRIVWQLLWCHWAPHFFCCRVWVCTKSMSLLLPCRFIQLPHSCEAT